MIVAYIHCPVCSGRIRSDMADGYICRACGSEWSRESVHRLAAEALKAQTKKFEDALASGMTGAPLVMIDQKMGKLERLVEDLDPRTNP